MKKFITVLIALIVFGAVVFTIEKFSFNAESICRTNHDSGNSYCRYTGLVEQVYVNKDGLALIYLGDQFDKALASQKGYVITNTNFVAIDIASKDISLSMFQSIEKAFYGNKQVELHMRSVDNGTLVVDRFWIK